jgi:hypothetical protein
MRRISLCIGDAYLIQLTRGLSSSVMPCKASCLKSSLLFAHLTLLNLANQSVGLYKSTTTATQRSSAQLHSPPQSLFQFHSILSENAAPKRQFKSSTMLKTNLCVRNSTKSQTPDANLFDFDESFVIQCEGNPSLSFHED